LTRSTNDFKLSENFIEKYKTKQAPFGYNGLGEFVFMRTYSRITSEGRNELWWETVKRVVEGIYNVQKEHIDRGNLGWNAMKAQKSAQEMYDLIFNIKFLPSGRALWAMGTDIISEKRLSAALYNCTFVSTENLKEDPSYPFRYGMDMLMCGVGVGFDVRGVGTLVVKEQSKNTENYIIPDSREGWVESIGKVIMSFFGQPTPIIDYSLIRPEGAPIRTFGGVSAGYKPLEELHQEIIKTLSVNYGSEITQRSIVDIFNFIGKAVVAGNVRRSAEVALGFDNEEFLNLKNYQINPERESYGWASNNSVMADTGSDYSKIAERIKDNAEPGVIWIQNMRRFGRMRELESNNIDFRIMGGNPCLEIGLESSELCNLTEVFPDRIETQDEFLRTLKYAYLFAKSVTLIETHWVESNRVMMRNRRLGVSITGIAQFIAHKGVEELKNWLKCGYDTLKNYDDIYSDWFAIPKSIKLTTVKPSGCQIGSTLIPTENGIYRLEELNNGNEKWQNHNINIYQENNKFNSTKFYKNGFAKTKKIKTNNGSWLESTYNHKYRIIRDDDYIWEEAQNIKVGDIIPFSLGCYDKKEDPNLQTFISKKVTNNVQIKQPNKMNKDIAWLLGLYFGDGSNHNKGIRIAGDISKVDILDKANSIVQDNFGINGIIYTRTKGNNADIYFNSQELLKYLKLNNLLKEKTSDIKIPKLIRMCSKESILSFIDGYASADGSFKTNGLSFCTTSEEWAKEFSILLRLVGMNSKVREFYSKTSMGKKKQYWISIRKGIDANQRYINSNVRKVRKIINNLGLNSFDFDTVESIEDGYAETYDIEVPENNCYIANGFVSHNTLSLLGGATPGVHYPESTYYIRRVRLANNSPLLPTLEKAGYKLEVAFGQEKSTVVVEFPVFAGDNVKTQEDISMWEQLAQAAFMQKYWSDNAVSVTVTFDPEKEGKDLERALDFYQYQLKGVSFLPKVPQGKYKQMPYEKIDKETYELMVSKLQPLDFNSMLNSVPAEIERYCNNDVCGI
jgi:intein/homing endonuclease